MLILEVGLTHFGKFHNKKITFSPGINLIYGENEGGKTTLHSFLRGMILGIEKPRGRESKDDLYTKYLPWETPSMYGGTMQIQSDDSEYLVERSFYKENKYLRVTNLNTGRQQEYESWKVPPQFGNVTKGSYRNTVSMEQSKSATNGELEAQMKNYMANLTTSQSSEVDIAYAMQTLMQKKKEQKKSMILERMEQLNKEVMELPGLERQRIGIAAQIERIRKERDNAPIEEENIVNQTKPQQMRMKLRKSTLFAAMWVILLFFLTIINRGDSINELLFPTFLVVGIVLFVIIKKREVRRLSEYLEDNQRQRVKNQEELKYMQNDARNKIIQIERLGWELEKLEERMGQLETKQEEYKELSKQLEVATENIKALQLAMDTIEKLSMEIHDGFGKQFNIKVSGLAEQITNHAYEKVYVDEKLNMKVHSQNSLISFCQLSSGTIDQLYFALRLAASDMLLESENMPIILDDSLAMYDEKRAQATISMLSKLNRQVLLFTCHKREREMLDQLKMEYHFIKL